MLDLLYAAKKCERIHFSLFRKKKLKCIPNTVSSLELLLPVSFYKNLKSYRSSNIEENIEYIKKPLCLVSPF